MTDQDRFDSILDSAADAVRDERHTEEKCLGQIGFASSRVGMVDLEYDRPVEPIA